MKVQKITTSSNISILKTFLKYSGLAISILLFSNSAFGQAPGYMGKRFLIGFEAPMIASIDLKKDDFDYLEPNSSGNFTSLENTSPFFYYRIKPTLYLEYVLNRKSSIQVFGRLFTSKVDVTPFYDTVAVFGQATFYPNSRVKTKSTSFGVKYRLFTGDALSPVGRYIIFGLEYATTRFFVEDGQFNSTDGYEATTRKPLDVPVSVVIPSFGFGTQRPIGQKLIFNFGFELGLPMGAIKFDPPSNPASEDWTDINSSNNFWRSYLASINIGIALAP